MGAGVCGGEHDGFGRLGDEVSSAWDPTGKAGLCGAGGGRHRLLIRLVGLLGG